MHLFSAIKYSKNALLTYKCCMPLKYCDVLWKPPAPFDHKRPVGKLTNELRVDLIKGGGTTVSCHAASPSRVRTSACLVTKCVSAGCDGIGDAEAPLLCSANGALD